MDKRQEELEKKRQKLAELRRAREERRLQESARTTSTGSPTIPDAATAATSPSLGDSVSANDSGISGVAVASARRQDVDALLSSLLDRPASPAVSIGSATTTAVDPSNASFTASSASRPTPTLVAVDAVIFDMPPKERVVYSKEIQTDTVEFDTPAPGDDADMYDSVDRDKRASASGSPSMAQHDKDQQHVNGVNDHASPAGEVSALGAAASHEISDEERKTIINSDMFREFFDRSSKYIERALNVADKYDFLRDYTISHDIERDDGVHKHIRLGVSHLNEKWARGRTVTSIAWSPMFHELYLASYSKNNFVGSGGGSDADGLVMVWNIHMPDRPEFVFRSQSDILSAQFSTFHPNLIIGGTYSGQILVWDTRAGTGTTSGKLGGGSASAADSGFGASAVLKTPLSSGGHTHPVFSMTMVGTTNAHHLVTASTDGLVCAWQLDMLAQPQEILELANPSHPKTDEVAVTTLDFPENETGVFWVGTEEGNIYQANRYDRAGSKAGINASDVYRSHAGLVTGLHFHPLAGPVDFSDLFLSCSVDWTICLWRVSTGAKGAAAASSAQSSASTAPAGTLGVTAGGAVPTSSSDVAPLCVFQEADDYVYDVQWSPTHPAVFASVDGSGNLDVWNLNRNKEVPSVRINVTGGKALNKLCFDHDGKRIVTGSSDGTTFVYELGEMFQPREDDWTLFQKTLVAMEAQAAEQKLYMRE
ncbi:hypothetical protein RI367_000688 [Sorochytrium milnesiophthora]